MKNSSIILIAVIAVVATVGSLVVSPYFFETTVDEPLPSSAVIQPTMEEKAMEEKAMEEKAMEEEISLITYSGNFVGVGDGIHDAQGIARTVPLEDGSQILRLEDFSSTNGPDLYVYLATDDRASEFVNLGQLKASKGNQNYEIPEGIDIEKYDKVLIWCKAFSVLFGSAELTSSS
jgi:hypothetical protein